MRKPIEATLTCPIGAGQAGKAPELNIFIGGKLQSRRKEEITNPLLAYGQKCQDEVAGKFATHIMGISSFAALSSAAVLDSVMGLRVYETYFNGVPMTGDAAGDIARGIVWGSSLLVGGITALALAKWASRESKIASVQADKLYEYLSS